MVITSSVPQSGCTASNVSASGMAFDLAYAHAFAAEVFVLPPNPPPKVRRWSIGITAPIFATSKAIHNTSVVDPDCDWRQSVPQDLQHSPQLGTQRCGEEVGARAMTARDDQPFLIDDNSRPSRPTATSPAALANRAIREDVTREEEVVSNHTTTPSDNKFGRIVRWPKRQEAMLEEWLFAV